jgi:hypothetical protein
VINVCNSFHARYLHALSHLIKGIKAVIDGTIGTVIGTFPIDTDRPT